MLYRLEKSRLAPQPENTLPTAEETWVCTLRFEELADWIGPLQLEEKLVTEGMYLGVSRLDEERACAYFILNIPSEDNRSKASQRMGIYLRGNLLLFLGNHVGALQALLEELCAASERALSLGGILYAFFDRLTYDDMVPLEHMEQRISSLEEGMITQRRQIDYTREIVQLRRSLLVLKRYYEQLDNILPLLEQESPLIDRRMARRFHQLSLRVDRLFHSVLTLRDYVTEVREAYQAQVDINLNQLMKLFTVISTICLPLTLVAGWYGMNFPMPEYHYPWAYPMVILLSVLILLGNIYYFRKHNWF